MPVTAVFAIQLVWFALVAALVMRLVVWPWSARFPPHQRAALFVAPQMSRVLGLGLLVPQLAPGMPAEMAVPTAIGDATTALLASIAFVLLHGARRGGLAVGWACMAVGILDGMHALGTAVRLQVAGNLATQWYVPVLNMPLMATCHVSGVIALRELGRLGSK